MKKKGGVAPPEFEGTLDAALLAKTRDYEAEKTRFGFIMSLFGNLATIVFIFGGLLDIYNSWIASLRLPFIAGGWLFFIVLACASEVLSVPFSLYHTFRIENAYGFNTMTPRLWAADFTKSLLISAVLLSLVVCGGLWLVRWSPGYWWLLVWSFLLAFSIFIMYVSPYVIEPLFNKFTPVEDESLREKIERLTRKVGIHAGRVLRMDASKRSKHTNAYFTGVGKTKRIVLYDTLIEGMNHEEILAVLAHEIGHWKKRHLFKSIVLLEVVSLIALYAAYRLVQGDILLSLFLIGRDTLFVKLVLLAFLGGIVSMPLKPLMNSLVRRHERQADRIAYALTGDADSIVSVFVKLSKENLSNLYPHPLYVSLYYSHPPILERIRYVRDLEKKDKKSGTQLPPCTAQ
ncbi:MAG: M48 family metallopeptidase [Nitrospirae bacterium]|nr:M48 family metallopeptidase [Nitrospirota bacterium]